MGTGREATGSPSVRMSTGLCSWISALLLLILTQMLTSLVVFGGEFICSSETLISPFHFCLIHRGQKFCDLWQRPDSGVKEGAFTVVIIFGLYAPLVFVAFAVLSTLFAAYGRDCSLLRFSVALQAASSLLTLTGLTSFLVLNHTYLSWEHMTVWFYVCSGVHFQLAASTALTYVSTKEPNPHWERLAEEAA